MVLKEFPLHRDARHVERDDAEHEKQSLALAMVHRRDGDRGDETGRAERGKLEERLEERVIEHLRRVAALPAESRVAGREIAQRPDERIEAPAQHEPQRAKSDREE